MAGLSSAGAKSCCSPSASPPERSRCLATRSGCRCRSGLGEMDLLHNLMLGFGVALTPFNIMFCLIGALIGTLVGVLPGIGPVATLAILLPTTFYLPPVAALIMLSGIYYG